MKKKFISLLLVLTMIFPVVPAASQAAGKGISERRTYTSGQFSDVAETDWYASGVKTAYEYGIMQGYADGHFGADDTLSRAEAVAMAARLHSLYYTGTDTFEQSSPWYQTYVDYAMENGILAKPYSDYAKYASRTEFVAILRNALPYEMLEKKNEVDDGAIPDVSISIEGATAIYDFYRAGILTGSDSKGNFQPSTNIDRASVAAIVARVVEPDLRQQITLQIPEITIFSKNSNDILSVPITQIGDYLNNGWNTIPRNFNENDFFIESSGNYKNTMTWGYGNGVLTIWGEGEITFDPDPNMEYLGAAHPWKPKDKIHTIYITQGISLDGQAFGLTFKNIFDDIGDYKSLRRVELPNTLTTIPNAAFNGCPLTRIGIPESVTFIAETNAFGDTNNKKETGWQLKNQDLIVYCVPGSTASEFATKYNVKQIAATQVFCPDGRTCMVSDIEKPEYLANGWYETPVLGIYAEDGQTQVVTTDEVSSYEAQGWHTNLKDICTTIYSEAGENFQVPKGLASAYEKAGWHLNEADAKSILYALDGRTTTVWKSEVSEYIAVGWYTQPMTLLYAADGRTLVVETTDVPTYEAMGWTQDINLAYTTMYALDGRTQEVPNEKIADNQAVGWYLYPDYVCANADIIVSSSGYADAVTYVESIMQDDTKKEYYSAIVNKRNSLCSAWQKAIGCPIAFLGSSIGHNSIGVPTVNIIYRNLSDVTLNAFELKFTCVDAYGKATTDWPTLYDGTFKGYSDNENLAPYSIGYGTWTLNSNERTTSIRNLQMIRAVFSDGSIWQR